MLRPELPEVEAHRERGVLRATKESDLTIDEWTCAEMRYRHAAAGRPPPVTAHKGVPAGGVALYTQVFETPSSPGDDGLGTNEVVTEVGSQGSVPDVSECAVFLTRASRKGKPQVLKLMSRRKRSSPTSKIIESGARNQLVGQHCHQMQRSFHYLD